MSKKKPLACAADIPFGSKLEQVIAEYHSVNRPFSINDQLGLTWDLNDHLGLKSDSMVVPFLGLIHFTLMAIFTLFAHGNNFTGVVQLVTAISTTIVVLLAGVYYGSRRQHAMRAKNFEEKNPCLGPLVAQREAWTAFVKARGLDDDRGPLDGMRKFVEDFAEVLASNITCAECEYAKPMPPSFYDPGNTTTRDVDGFVYTEEQTAELRELTKKLIEFDRQEAVKQLSTVVEVESGTERTRVKQRVSES